MDSNILKILLIEDNPGDARLIEEMLRETNLKFKLECAGSLSAGIGLIGSKGFDVILLDLGLPDSRGLGTLSRLNECGHVAPVIVLTGLTDDAAGIEAVKAGAQDYLIKGQINKILLARSINYAVERKKIELTLHESEEKFSKAFHSSPQSISITSLNDGRIIEMNDSITKSLGYSRQEAIGHTTIELGIWITPEDRIKFVDSFKKNGYVRNMELDLRAKKGNILSMLLSSELIDVAGNACMLSTFYDITERKRAVEELRKYRDHLEDLVKERTAQLNQKNEELEKFNKLFVGRELRMIELKKKIAELEKKCGSPGKEEKSG